MAEDFSVIGRIRTSRGKAYPVVLDKTAFGTRFKVTDSSVPMLAALLREFPNDLNRALGSVGYWVRAVIRGALNHEGRPYADWPPVEEISFSRRDKAGGWSMADNPFQGQPFGALVQAVGYLREKAKFQVSIGWLSKAAARLGGMLQAGFRTRVTHLMRRRFIRAGYRLGKSEIVSPARPLIRPVYSAVEPRIGARIEARIQKYLRERRLAA